MVGSRAMCNSPRTLLFRLQCGGVLWWEGVVVGGSWEGVVVGGSWEGVVVGESWEGVVLGGSWEGVVVGGR